MRPWLIIQAFAMLAFWAPNSLAGEVVQQLPPLSVSSSVTGAGYVGYGQTHSAESTMPLPVRATTAPGLLAVCKPDAPATPTYKTPADPMSPGTLTVATVPQWVEALPLIPNTVATFSAYGRDDHAVQPDTDECHAPTFYAWGDYLYWVPRGADIPFAQPVNGPTPNQSPAGAVAFTSPNYASGFRTGAGLGICDHSVLQAGYTYYRTNSHDETRILPGGDVALRSLLVFPTTLNAAADSLQASANTEIDFQFADIDFKHVLCCCPRYHLYWLVGGRWARLNQALEATYLITGTTNVTGNVTFNGLGGRIGLDGDYNIGRGFFTYGKGFMNLLVGKFTSSYEQTNVFLGTQAATSTIDDRLVPILELEIGLGFSSCQDRIRVSAGYSFAGWFNTLTMNSLVQGVQNTNFTTNSDNFRDTLTFDGLTVRAEFRW